VKKVRRTGNITTREIGIMDKRPGCAESVGFVEMNERKRAYERLQVF
jgi:hypothetical protein